jgi:hypothetical protein
MGTRELKKGMKILFFGTKYIIDEVLNYDTISVVQNNGIKIHLWFPDLPGREILQ